MVKPESAPYYIDQIIDRRHPIIRGQVFGSSNGIVPVEYQVFKPDEFVSVRQQKPNNKDLHLYILRNGDVMSFASHEAVSKLLYSKIAQCQGTTGQSLDEKIRNKYALNRDLFLLTNDTHKIASYVGSTPQRFVQYQGVARVSQVQVPGGIIGDINLPNKNFYGFGVTPEQLSTIRYLIDKKLFASPQVFIDAKVKDANITEIFNIIRSKIEKSTIRIK